jgi:hypothetical protein
MQFLRAVLHTARTRCDLMTLVLVCAMQYMSQLSSACAVVFIYPNTTTQAAVACLLAGITLAVALRFRPHCDTVSEHVYITGSTLIVLTMFLALLIKAGVNEADTRSQDVYSVLLVLMNVAIIAVALLQVVLAGRTTLFAGRELAVVVAANASSKGVAERTVKSADDCVNEAGVNAPK